MMGFFTRIFFTASSSGGRDSDLKEQRHEQSHPDWSEINQLTILSEEQLSRCLPAFHIYRFC
jgi:hypothetical protein